MEVLAPLCESSALWYTLQKIPQDCSGPPSFIEVIHLGWESGYKHDHYLNLFHTVAIMRFEQSSYSTSESMSPLSVNLVLDATSGTTTQAIVEEITASAQASDTATGKAK